MPALLLEFHQSARWAFESLEGEEPIAEIFLISIPDWLSLIAIRLISRRRLRRRARGRSVCICRRVSRFRDLVGSARLTAAFNYLARSRMTPRMKECSSSFIRCSLSTFSTIECGPPGGVGRVLSGPHYYHIAIGPLWDVATI